MSYTPASRTTLADSVVEQLLDQLRRGILKPGDKLPTERMLMEKFGVGRSTVREALQSLARMNLIEARPGAGTTVKEFDITGYLRPDVFALMLSQSDAAAMLEAREVIEVAIIGMAARRADHVDLERIAEVLRSSREALSHEEPTYEYSALFHLALAEAAHNVVLLNVMHSIYGILRVRGQRTVDLPAFIKWEIKSHQELLDLVKAGDVLPAQDAMRKHLRHSAHKIDHLPAGVDDPLLKHK
jgi:DNA-binding FadR family transcriptional regulator